MTRITTHVLDLAAGRPAAAMGVRLERVDEGGVVPVAGGTTDTDGRIRAWPAGDAWPAGQYGLVFDTGAWFAQEGRDTLYPEIVIRFQVREGEAHYHVPLLLSPFGYSTYRGS